MFSSQIKIEYKFSDKHFKKCVVFLFVLCFFLFVCFVCFLSFKANILEKETALYNNVNLIGSSISPMDKEECEILSSGEALVDQEGFVVWRYVCTEAQKAIG